MEECERVIISRERRLADLVQALVNLEPGQTCKISRSPFDQYLLLIPVTNSPTSTPSKASPESSGPLRETSSTIGDISMHARAAICTLQLPNSSGPIWGGPAILHAIESSPNSLIIDITIDDSCAKRLGTELITEVNQGHSPPRLRLRLDLSKTFSPHTSAPSPP